MVSQVLTVLSNAAFTNVSELKYLYFNHRKFGDILRSYNIN